MRADARVCANTLREGSRSFAAAALLLPPTPRRHARALYAFCRVADDLIDHAPPGARASVIADLHHRLDAACRRVPEDYPADRGFAEALHACAIPRALPEALLEGFMWDADGRRYRGLSDLLDYAARVAGTVGAMMALVLGARDQAAIARACELGVAMQLSNIARDVAEDAAAGRLYLPLDWLAEMSISPDALLGRPAGCPGLTKVIERLVAQAEALYTRAESGIALLPLTSRPAIRAAARLYREIGREVGRRGGAALLSRTVVPPARKAALIALCPFGAGHGRHAPPLPQTAFLIQAVPRPIRQSHESALVWTLELFARLEQRDQLRLPG